MSDHPKPACITAARAENGPETRTTAFEPRSCTECAKPLKGQKMRFCSPRCRMRRHRATRHKHLRSVFDVVRALLDEIEGEMLRDRQDVQS